MCRAQHPGASRAVGPLIPGLRGRTLLALDEPDVLELERIAVALQDERARRAFKLGVTVAAGWAGNLDVVLYENAVEADGDAGLSDNLVILAHGVREVDVVGLPGQRREAHVELRLGLGVDAAGLVVLAVQAEGVEDLDLVVVDHVEAAVTATLAAGVRAEGEHELSVDGVVLEL